MGTSRQVHNTLHNTHIPHREAISLHINTMAAYDGHNPPLYNTLPWRMVSSCSCSYLEPTLGTLNCPAQGLQHLILAKLDNNRRLTASPKAQTMSGACTACTPCSPTAACVPSHLQILERCSRRMRVMRGLTPHLLGQQRLVSRSRSRHALTCGKQTCTYLSNC